jgi:predicted ATPase
MAQMQEGLTAYQATGAGVFRQAFLLCLAEAQGWGGHAAAGLGVLAEAEEVVHSTGESWWEAELYRLKGELVLGSEVLNPPLAEAEACFQQALDIARHQEAKSLELRAAMSLARLWQQQGKRAEAHALLAPVYGWFTEGFDTPDLQEAKALLVELEA